jgi:hypothetical protein
MEGTCANCGVLPAVGDMYCGNCGQPMPAAAAPAAASAGADARLRTGRAHMTSDYHSSTEDPRPQWAPGENVAEPISSAAPSVGAVQYHDPTAFQQPPARQYVYRNPVLYAFGGVFFPPLVLFLMGGDRKTCIIMLCIWPISFLLLFLLFIGAIPLVGMYFWSIAACYREAVKQNEAHGLG